MSDALALLDEQEIGIRVPKFIIARGNEKKFIGLVQLHVAGGLSVVDMIAHVGISESSYYAWTHTPEFQEACKKEKKRLRAIEGVVKARRGLDTAQKVEKIAKDLPETREALADLLAVEEHSEERKSGTSIEIEHMDAPMLLLMQCIEAGMAQEKTLDAQVIPKEEQK